MTDYVKMAKQALERPSDFGWWGRDDMFETWGITGPHFATNSDDTISESNFEVFKDMAAEKFGTDDDEFGPNIDIAGIKHWAVGPMDSVICRILKGVVGDNSHRCPVDDDCLTDEFKWICDILLGLKDYPLLDDEHHSELEWEQNYQAFIDYGLPSEVDSSKADEIVDILYNQLDVYIDDSPGQDDIYLAAYLARAEDREFAAEEWDAWEFLNPGPVMQRYAADWEEAGQIILEAVNG